jgi:hypothetical protein
VDVIPTAWPSGFASLRPFVLALVALACAVAADALATETVAAKADAEQRAAEDARLRKLVIGTWQDDYQGKRTMTLNEDGRGTMIVELTGLSARLFASRLEFDMRWSLENGRLKKRTVGGKPEARVQMILKTMGDRVDEPILELNDRQLLLLDKDGKTKYDWRRVPRQQTP